ncbi:MAG: alpha-amylase [Arenicella sp.]|jgi:alpha-amylase
MKKTEIADTSNVPFLWESANFYFLLTDRFYNGNKKKKVKLVSHERIGKLRGFMGGDIAGVTQKLNEGYFTDLGVNVLWLTPIFKQTEGGTDEGMGRTYAFHGYWPRDFTAIDPHFGTMEELKELVETAHSKHIRIVMDVIINHIGPVTEKDPVWEKEWVRTGPICTYDNYESTVSCTLVENLPDIRTESDEAVELPSQLVEKWKEEGRYEQEVAELDAFFERTSLPRSPKNHIIKWITDYVRELGIDGFRFDTVKHVEEAVFNDVKQEGLLALKEWKEKNPSKKMDNSEFFMAGEVYGYGASSKNYYDFGDKKVDYFKNGFDGLINFQFLHDAQEKGYEELFSFYNILLATPEMKGNHILNYLSSHDDEKPFDPTRLKPIESANKLLLSPGASQIYYGDEIARSLKIEGTEGDATLRSFMNWEDLESNEEVNGFKTKDILTHWQKIGKFRASHPAVGAGKHTLISKSPYIFSRSFQRGDFKENVVVGLELPTGKKVVEVKGNFADGSTVLDKYSGKTAEVKDGKVIIDSLFEYILLESLPGNVL